MRTCSWILAIILLSIVMVFILTVFYTARASSTYSTTTTFVDLVLQSLPERISTNVYTQLLCEYPIQLNISAFFGPLTRHGSVSYRLPRPNSRNLLSERLLEDETLFVFIHINKAGGTFVKEEIFKPAAHERKWDGVGYGTTLGWKQLMKGCNSKTPVNPAAVGYPIDEAIACGNYVPLSPCGPLGGGNCPLRLLWGTHSMGMCQLYPNKPCVMTVVLRHPVERLISQYNYVCVDGKEGQKKWLESWRLQGRCPLSLLQFLDSELTSDTFLIDHLARAADPKCGVRLAVENLLHPCVRFLLLDRLSDGLERLAKIWGPAMRPFIDKTLAMSSSPTNKKNHAPYSSRMRTQMDDPIIIDKVRQRLKSDIEFYEKAVELYETQWERPLESCNDLTGVSF
jgi:hypothetical protein